MEEFFFFWIEWESRYEMGNEILIDEYYAFFYYISDIFWNSFNLFIVTIIYK